MKTIITSIVTVLIVCSISLSQPTLEVVWQKRLYPTKVDFAKFSKDGNYIYCAVGNTIKKMDSKTGDFISTFDNVDSSFIYIVDRMQISNSGNFIVAHNGNGAAFVYDTRNERKVKQIQLGASAVTLSTDDRFLIFGSSRPESKGIVVYNLMNDTIERVINYQHNGINQIKISHDGRYFVTGSTVKNYDNTFNDQLILWDAVTMQQISVLESINTGTTFGGFNKLVFSIDDKYLGSVRRKPWEVIIHNLVSKERIKKSDGRSCVNIEYLPDSTSYMLSYIPAEIYDINTDKLIEIMNKYMGRTASSYSSRQLFVQNGDSIFLYTMKPTTSVAEEITNTFTLSPNPATDYIEVAIPTLKRGLGGVAPVVRVYDVLGKEVLNTSMSFLRKQESPVNTDEIPGQAGNDSSIIRLDVSHLPPGVYFVQSGNMVQSFVKM